MQSFKLWYRGLTSEEKSAFADRAKVSRAYIETHLVYRRRTPRPETMRRLAAASLGRLSYTDVVRFFLLEPAP